MITRPQAEDVLRRLRRRKPREFSSHDFIKVYCSRYEREYIDWLISKSGRGRAFQTVHSQIGRFLMRNEGKISPVYLHTDRNDSETVHGTIDQPMWWEWCG